MILPPNTHVPTHLALITDGNRRWARQRNKSPNEGHKAGADRLIQIIKNVGDIGIRYFTFWAFSTENWKRDIEEINGLVSLLGIYIKKLEKDFHINQTRFKLIGRRDRFDPKLIDSLENLEQSTTNYSKYYIVMGLDYGGRDEIIRTFNKMNKANFDFSNITEKDINDNLDTADIPDPDLIIRTSGEQRLSGFLPWQSTYAELYFSPTLLPDFDEDELLKAIISFSDRERRFGGK